MSLAPFPPGQPFTFEEAARAGISATRLQSSAWRQVFRGVWVDATTPDSRDLRLHAARLRLPARGVLCGLTAASVHGADVRRLNDLDVHVGFPKGKRVRGQDGLVVCQETLELSDICLVAGVQVTTPTRTTFDCLRCLRAVEGIIVADSLTHLGLTTVEQLAAYFASKRRLRNLRIGERRVELVEPLTESPMETRLRLELVMGGLPRPQAQYDVRTAGGVFIGRLDLAYPEAKIGVEYDGADHWKQRRDDDRRRTAMRDLGWEIYVYSADDVFLTPDATVAEVRRALRARAA